MVEWHETGLAPDSRLREVVAVYADGGVIHKNPSPFGGTWAYVLIDKNEEVVEARSGLVPPDAVNGLLVTNNVTELLAVCYGLSRLPDYWEGTVFSDSQITLRRVFQTGYIYSKWEGVHDDHREWAINCRNRLGMEVDSTLLAGHPTVADLANGYKIKKEGPRRWPVSRFNVMCDTACGLRAELWRVQNGGRLRTKKNIVALTSSGMLSLADEAEYVRKQAEEAATEREMEKLLA